MGGVSNDAFTIGTLSAQAPVVKRQNVKAQTAEIKSRTIHPTLVQLRAAQRMFQYERDTIQRTASKHVARQTLESSPAIGF